jgi:acyl-coenzyme A thioesterase PaaI-like protein
MAAVLDEAMGAAVWLEGLIVVAVRLATDFRRLLPIGTEATVEAWVSGREGRKVATRGHLLGADGVAFAEAEGLFVELDPGRFATLLERAARAQGLDPETLLQRVGAATETPQR